MKNGLKNAALVLLTLATVGLAGKVINDSTGFVDKLIGKKPDSANYLQVGDELLGKTVYFDMPAFVEDYGDYSGTLTFGTLSYEGEAKTGGATLTPVWHYVPQSHMMQFGVTYGPTSYVFSIADTAESGIDSHSFPEKIELELTGGSFQAEVTSLKIETLNEGLDLNRYFAYSEDALTEWQSWRKIHPFVTTSEGTSSETTNSSESVSPTSDSTSESEVEVKEKIRIETYVQEITPILQEDEDGRFGEFC